MKMFVSMDLYTGDMDWIFFSVYADFCCVSAFLSLLNTIFCSDATETPISGCLRQLPLAICVFVNWRTKNKGDKI